MMRLKDLKISRGGFHLSVDYLEVPRGQLVGLVGPSGSGKSTLLEAIAGFVPIECGEIRVGERVIEHLAPEKRQVAIVFQRPTLFPYWNLEDNVTFGLRIQGVSKVERRRRGQEWLERVGLGGLAMRRPDEISEGQAQRVALARALITGFPVLLLDEPFSSLDIATRQSLYPLLREMVEQTQVCALLVSHQPEEVQALAARAYALKAVPGGSHLV